MSYPTLFDYSMIKGTVDAILFQNTDNFYTVLKVDTIESNEKFDSMPTVVGFLPNVVEGDVYTFKGQVVQHPRYGKQLKAETFEKELPQTKEAIISYLSSDLFKGFQHRAGVSPYTSPYGLAETCVFDKQSLGPIHCGSSGREP